MATLEAPSGGLGNCTASHCAHPPKQPAVRGVMLADYLDEYTIAVHELSLGS